MNTAVKKILLTGSALVAVSFATAGIAQAQQTIGAGQTTEIDNSGLVTLDAANAMGTLADGASLTHNVVATTTGQGTFRTLGNATGITGTIGVGGGGPIAAVSIHGGTGTTAVFNGAVNANSLDFSGAGSATFNAATTITGPIAMLASHTLTTGDGLFTATGGITGAGNVTLAGTGGLTLGAPSAVAKLTKNSAGSSTITGTLVATATEISGGGTLVAANTTLNDVTFGANGGVISSGTGITSIAGNANFTGTGTVEPQVTNIAVTTTAGGTGTIVVSHDSSTLSGATLASGTGLTFGGTTIGAVAGAGSTLTLNRAGDQQVGAVGAANNALTLLDLAGSGIKTLTAAVHAVETNIGAVTVNSPASFVGNVKFTGDGILNLADNAGVSGTGHITTDTNGHGTVNLAGSSAIDGPIGADTKAIGRLNINGGAGTSVAFGGTTHAGTIAFSSAGTLNMGNNSGGSQIAHLIKTGAASTATVSNSGTTMTIGDIDVAAGGTLDVNGPASSGNATLGTGATLSYEGAVLGNVTGAGSTLILDGGAAQQVGAIGADGQALTTVNLSGLGDKTITGAVYAGTTNIGDINVTAQNTTFHSAVVFGANTILNLVNGTTITGNVSSTTAGHGTINNTNNLKIVGDLARLNTVVLTGAMEVTGNAVAADNMNVGIHTMTVGGAFETTANTQLTYRVNTPTTSGKITAAGEATVVAGTRVNMIVDTSVYVAQGQEFVLVDGAESGGHVAKLADGNLTTTNTALLHFKQKITDTNNLVVYADRVQMNKAAKVPNNAAVGTMLDSLGAGGDKDVTALQVALGKLDTEQQVEAMLATLVPDVSGGSINAAVSVGGSTSTVVSNRVASLRAGESYGTGMAAGNWAEGGHFWGQVFGSSADQDRRGGIAGYDAESYGAVFGVDTEMADSIRAGLAFAYANTEVDGEDANRTQTDLDSYQISLYGSYDLPDNYFLTGQISYMYSDIDTTRYNVGQIAGNNARADFSSNQYSIRTEVGRDYTVEGTRFSLTPSGTFNYTYVDLEDYTERGAGGLSLRNVDTDEVQILEFGGNLKAEAKFEDHAGGSITPNVHAGYRYDVIGDKVATVGRLSGGGAAFKSEGSEPSQHTVNVGTGIKWATAGDFEFTANYDYEHKSDYAEHSGFIRAGFKF